MTYQILMEPQRTFTVQNLADFDHEGDIENQKSKFPGARYADIRTLKYDLGAQLEAVLSGTSEEAIQRFLTANPYLLQYVVPNSGHHGFWVFPKKQIRTTSVNGRPGLIPDYLVAASNSLGYTWHIIELKRASVQFSKANGVSYSRDAADGIAQCVKYRSHFADYIENVRINIGISDVITPQSVILVIGDSSRETAAQQACRNEFDKLTPSMSIVSYDRIRRGLANDRALTSDSSPLKPTTASP